MFNIIVKLFSFVVELLFWSVSQAPSCFTSVTTNLRLKLLRQMMCWNCIKTSDFPGVASKFKCYSGKKWRMKEAVRLPSGGFMDSCSFITASVRRGKRSRPSPRIRVTSTGHISTRSSTSTRWTHRYWGPEDWVSHLNWLSLLFINLTSEEHGGFTDWR